MASILGFGRVQLASVYRLNLPRWRGGWMRPGQAKPAASPSAASLTSLVEYEIIPRLVASHPLAFFAGGPVAIAADPVNAITLADVDAFAPMTLQVEADLLLDYVETLLARGVTVDCILVDLLAPAARRLGEYWEDDRCDFVDVTMGLWRLQEIVHELGTRLPAERRSPFELRALFASMPGDQHSFGAVVVEEMFVREGWLTDRLSEATLADLLERVSADVIDLVGLTVSCDEHAKALAMTIQAVRAASRNPDVKIMIGGRAAIADPGLAYEAGADGTAADARLAVCVAKDLVGAVRPEISACG